MRRFKYDDDQVQEGDRAARLVVWIFFIVLGVLLVAGMVAS